MNDPIAKLVPFSDAAVTSRLYEAPAQPVQITAVSETETSNTRQAGAGTDGKLQERLAEVVDKLNERMRKMQRSLEFSVDDSSGRIVVKVIDKGTDEVIRQIPSEEMLAIMKHINDDHGQLFNARV